MRYKAIEYPHPVLNEYMNDFPNCSFSVDIVSHGDNGNNLELEIQYSLNCPGILDMIVNNIAKICIRIHCHRTFYRTIKDIDIGKTTLITIPKHLVSEALELQGIIVATKDIDSYKLNEFNNDYFSGLAFKLRKGAVIANEPGLKIKLNSILEKNVSGIVQITGSSTITEMKIHYASTEETNPALSNYIVITLPSNEYRTYINLRTKKHLKKDIERFLQAAIILPAITEAISLLRREDLIELTEADPHYKGTVWADSIIHALFKLGVEDLVTCPRTDYELANLILGNVVNDSINNLMQKLIDWSTIQQEDESL